MGRSIWVRFRSVAAERLARGLDVVRRLGRLTGGCFGRLSLLGFILVLVGGCTPRHTEPIALRLDDRAESATFGAVLLGPFPSRLDNAVELGEPDLGRALSVWKGEVALSEGCVAPSEHPPLLGRFRLAARYLAFEPRFPLSAGSVYQACADLARLARTMPGLGDFDTGSSALITTFEVAGGGPSPGPPTVVTAWPPAGLVPENLLRMYVHFSQPMSPRAIASRVFLIDESGEVIPDAFVQVPEGLWDTETKRLTLFLHPGRIKRGVGPHEELGLALRSGSAFSLRVDGSVESRFGVAMGEAFEQRYEVNDADRQAPEPGAWQVLAPHGPREPVTVRFDEVLDREQLLSFGFVATEGGRQVSGTPAASPDGMSWSLVPDEPWLEGGYVVVARVDIEDLAGNSPHRLFEVSTAGLPGATRSLPLARGSSPRDVLSLPFDVRLER